MAKVRSWAGLDVHAAKVVAVTVDGASGELRAQRLSGQTAEVVAFCAGLPGPARVAYEAGPTGFGLARALQAAGIGCVVAAPGKIERPAQDRVKTDRRDAERLVRLLMIGGLHAVRVPSSEEEALRDLVRAREDVRGDLMRARHRLGKLLLRHDVRYDGAATRGPQRHRDWLGQVDLGDRGAQVTLLDYLGAIDALVVRRDALRGRDRRARPRLAVGADGRPAALPARHRHALGGRALRRDRRLRALRARRAADELPRPGALRDSSSGEQRRPGRDHQVRLAARPPAAGRGRLALPPSPGQGRRAQPPPGRPAPGVIAISWKAQQRLHRTWRRLDTERGKRRTLVRGRRRTRAGRLLLGDHDHRRLNPSRTHHVG